MWIERDLQCRVLHTIALDKLQLTLICASLCQELQSYLRPPRQAERLRDSPRVTKLVRGLREPEMVPPASDCLPDLD